ncbi:hypothetical protein K501DRAFT_66600 [Backusella circina FSU 941]|nr:hypothetical protein K501DRAFT_66600 [Backusella circina FSU 941]
MYSIASVTTTPPAISNPSINYGQSPQQQPLSPTYAQLQMNSAALGNGSPRSTFTQAVPLRASPPSSPTTSTHPQRHTAPSSPLTTQIQPPQQQPEANNDAQVMSPRSVRTTAVPASSNYSAAAFPTQKQTQSLTTQHIPQLPTPPTNTPPTAPRSLIQTSLQLQPLPSLITTVQQDGQKPTGFNISLPGGLRASRQLLPQEVAKYKSLQGQVIKTFQLDHGQNITRKPFFISREDFNRLYSGSNTRAFLDPAHLPLTYILNSWHNDSSSTKCDWPASLKVELNGRFLTLDKRKKIVVPNRPPTLAGKDKPYDLSPQLREGENVLVLHQVECACVRE